MAGVAGNVIGSWAAYAVGLYGGRPFIDKYGKYILLRHHHVELAERWFAKYGPATVFFSRLLPIVRTFISLPAGIGKMPFWKFTVYTTAGCIPWVLLLGWIGLKAGDNWEAIRAQLHYADYVVAAAIVGLRRLQLLKWRRGRRARMTAAIEAATPRTRKRSPGRRTHEPARAVGAALRGLSRPRPRAW